MNTSPGPESALTPTLNTAGNMMKPAEMATKVSMTHTLMAEGNNFVSLLK